MAVIVFEFALVSADHIYNWGQCEMRQYVNSLTNTPTRDLNYNSANLEEVIAPFNSWLNVEDERLTVNSFPFVVYRKIDSKKTFIELVVHRTLESLKADQFLIDYNRENVD